ncbi:ABC transporter permease [Pinisolibacter sp.]|uniref:ABC transporter permease n=1 Tax=Pinisolibacter sp. TaxID=2172024 RepID=UPI002FDEB668
MKVSKVFELGIKELRGLARDPILLVLIVFAFSVSIYAAATAMPEMISNAAIATVDQDRSPLSERIVGAFTPPYFARPVAIGAGEADRRMDLGLDTFTLWIPPDFQRDVLAGRTPALRLDVDATRMSQAFTGSGYVQAIVASEVSEFLAHRRSATSMPVELVLRARFNPNLDPGRFSAVMEVINAVTMLSIILTGTALIREREHGTIEHLLVMPVTPGEIMVAKVWSMGAVVLAAAAFSLTVVVRGALAVPIEGSVMLFLAGVVVHLFATTSAGIFLATVSGSMPQFGLMLMLVLLPLQVLSGATTPRESMPEFIQYLMLTAPNTHFVKLAQAILYRGAGFDIVWPQFAALAVIGTVLFVLALKRFRAYLQ